MRVSRFRVAMAEMFSMWRLEGFLPDFSLYEMMELILGLGIVTVIVCFTTSGLAQGYTITTIAGGGRRQSLQQQLRGRGSGFAGLSSNIVAGLLRIFGTLYSHAEGSWRYISIKHLDSLWILVERSDQLWVEALAMVEDTLLKIVLMLVATPGMMAPAATATNPAISAYSIRSCPLVSFQMTSLKKNRVKCSM